MRNRPSVVSFPRKDIAIQSLRGKESSLDRKRVFENLEATPEARKDKIAALKKAIREGTYQIRPEDIADKILKGLILELALTPNGCEYREGK